jgi:Holliday junction resolvase
VFSGKNNGNYQGAGFRSCEACGKEYKSYDKNRRYCSSDCSAAAAVNTAMTARKQGRYGELLCQRKLESLGYLVVRSMASRGPYDIVAIKPDHILLVQVKSMKRKNQHVIDEAVQLLRESPSTTTAKRQLWCLIGKYKSRVAFSDVTWEVTEV